MFITIIYAVVDVGDEHGDLCPGRPRAAADFAARPVSGQP